MSSDMKKDFFGAISMGSMSKLKRMIESNGKETMIGLAKCYNNQGETPLINAIKNKHPDIFTFLIHDLEVDISQNSRFWWKGVNWEEVPPLLAAIVSDQLTMVKQLIDLENVTELAVGLLSILSSSCTRQQKIDALELMGAAYILFDYGIWCGIPCWMEAMTLRNSTPDGEQELPKIPYHVSESERNPIRNAAEVMTLEQLQHLYFNFQLDEGELLTQAFLVSHRILSQTHPGVNLFTLYILHHLARKYFTKGLFSHAIDISMFILESYEIQQWENLMFVEAIENTQSGILVGTYEIITNIFQKITPSRRSDSFAQLMKIFNIACAIGCARPDERTSIERHTFPQEREVTYILDMISLLDGMLPQLNEKESSEYKSCLDSFVRLHYKWDLPYRNLLHMACDNFNIPTYVIQLLLQAGADPNAPDLKEDNTPLHLLARVNYGRDLNTDAIRLLVDAGGHVDLVNKKGTTVLDMLRLRQKHQLTVYQELSPNPEIQSLINTALPLTCSCARIIRKFDINVQKLPSSLESFVYRH